MDMDDIIEAVEKIIGEGNCYACVPRYPDVFEICTHTVESAKKLSNGINVGELNYKTRMAYSPYTIVSFMNIPSYIGDEKITAKLEYFNIEIVGDIIRNNSRKFNHYTNGTRHVKCIFPPNIKSLPWAVNLETIDGVIHNNQTKVCFKCLSDLHMIADSPNIKYRFCQGAILPSKYIDALEVYILLSKS